MFGRFERMVAGRYLRARRGERFASIIAVFSLIGIALGVATLIIVMAVMNGFKADLMSRILGLNGDLTIYGAGQNISNYQDDIASIRTVPGVTRTIALAQGTVLLSAGHFSAGGVVRGISQDDLKALHAISDNFESGRPEDIQGDDAVAIGWSLASHSGLSVGDRITIMSPNGQATPFGTMPRIKAYRIAGIFRAGVNDYDGSVVLMPLKAAQHFLMMPDQVSLIQVSTSDPMTVQPVTREIARKLDDPRLQVVDWAQENNAFLGAITVEQNVMFLILTLIILVAAFNVISSLIMMVKDKTADIAVLRTIGASRGAVMRIFLMCGAFVGVTGTLAGTALGVIFCINIEHIRHVLERITHTNLFDPTVYYLERLPAKLVWSQVLEVMVMALALSLLATLYPSWRAARTDPIEALRHE